MPVRPEHYQAIAQLDADRFSRDEPRTIANIQCLVETSEGVAFAYVLDGQVAGYVFAKRLGQTAYIGPLGVQARREDLALAVH